MLKMSGFFSHTKSRDPKIPHIEPIKVLILNWVQNDFEYEAHTLVGLKFKVKTKPDLINNQGENIWRGKYERGIYEDTPKNRELLQKAQLLRNKITLIRKDISQLVKQLDKVDTSRLHERILKANDTKEIEE